MDSVSKFQVSVKCICKYILRYANFICIIMLLKREDNRPYLLARALDQVTDGVQIYDKTAWSSVNRMS